MFPVRRETNRFFALREKGKSVFDKKPTYEFSLELLFFAVIDDGVCFQEFSRKENERRVEDSRRPRKKKVGGSKLLGYLSSHKKKIWRMKGKKGRVLRDDVDEKPKSEGFAESCVNLQTIRSRCSRYNI